jgi:hypothetical protein
MKRAEAKMKATEDYMLEASAPTAVYLEEALPSQLCDFHGERIRVRGPE